MHPGQPAPRTVKVRKHAEAVGEQLALSIERCTTILSQGLRFKALLEQFLSDEIARPFPKQLS